MNKPQELNPRNATIDGWRGLSIILVLLGHFGHAIGDESFLVRYSFADEGVHIFFIISGYLITHLLLTRMHSQRKETQPIKKFYIRRFLRILPAFYTFHITLLCLRYFNIVEFTDLLFLKNILFLSNFSFWGSSVFLVHIWSLAVEEQFYLIWPWIMYYIPLPLLKWLCLFVIGLSPLVRVANYLYPEYALFWAGAFFQHADSIAFGALLSILLFTDEIKKFGKWPSTLPLVLLGTVTASIWWIKHNFLLGIITVPLFYSFFNLFFTFLIMESMAIKLPMLSHILNNRILGFIGKISFSLYLWQQLFLLPAQYQDENPGLFFQQIPGSLIWVFLVAILSYYLVEMPFLRLKERWSL